MSYPRHMAEDRFTEYFETEVLRKRPYLRKVQEHNRVRFWAKVPELGDRVLRVVTLEDKLTIHNAFLDRGFKP